VFVGIQGLTMTCINLCDPIDQPEGIDPNIDRVILFQLYV